MAGKEKDAKNAKVKGTNTSRFNPIKYLKEVITEIKKVTWPDMKELRSYTVAVFAFIAVFAILYGTADLGLAKLLSLIVSS